MRARATSDLQKKRAGARAAAAAQPSGFWDEKVSPVLERFALPLALCLILVGAVRIANTYRQLSVTIDEPYHFRAGMQYLAGQFRDHSEQPPLEQAAAALLPLWSGARLDPDVHEDNEALRQVLRKSPDPWHVITLMRAGVLPFFALAALVVFFGARWYFGGAAAVLATAFFTWIPPVLAHAGLATTDIALTATVPAAFFALTWWAGRPGRIPSAVLGASTALAILSKFSALVYLPAAAVLALVFFMAEKKPSRAELVRMVRERVPGAVAAAAVCAVLVWAGYRFSFGPVPAWHSGLRVPAPEFFQGLYVLAEHNQQGQGAYLLGQFNGSGWWYYFPVALSVKTPIALLALAAVGLFECWRRRRRDGLLPVALCLGVLLPALPSRINIGVRHVLPIYAGISIIAALGVLRLARWLRGGGVVAALVPGALVVWLVVSGAQAHPDYLQYFNAFAGDQPDDVLLNSDFDWDQDLILASRRLRALGVSKVWLDLWRPDFATSDVLQRVYGFPPVQPPDADLRYPSPGWHIINTTILRIQGSRFRGDEKLDGVLAGLRRPWYERVRPTDRAGGLLLFHIPPDFNR